MVDQACDSEIIASNEVVEKLVAEINIGKTDERRIFLVGDSTVSPFKDEIYLPRYGWGMEIQNFVDESKAEVVNLAISGRSSKSFLIEKNYEILKKYLKKDDFLLIGFGHNDEKYEEARYSNPNLDKNTEGSFKNFLLKYYVDLARNVGATPVLCTPIVRRSPTDEYTGMKVHISPDKDGFKGGDYPRAIRLLAADEGILLVDLTLMTKCLYEKLGAVEAGKLHSAKSPKYEDIDNSHLNETGAKVIAKMVCEDLAKKDLTFMRLLKNA